MNDLMACSCRRWLVLTGLLMALGSGGSVASFTVHAQQSAAATSPAPASPAPASPTSAAEQSPALPAEVTGFFTQYCQACHGAENPKAGLSVSTFSNQLSLLKHRKKWEQLLNLVRDEEMPPEDSKQPTAEQRKAFAESVRRLFAEADRNAKPDPGRVTARRLNRVEYNNTIRDLLDVDLKPAEDFPADDVGHGFDNIGDVLTLSPVLMERYLAAAESIATRAVLTEIPKPSVRYLAGRFLHPYPHNTPEAEGRFRPLRPTDKNPIFSGPLIGNADYFKFSADEDLIFRARFYSQKKGDAPAYAAIFISGPKLIDPSPDEEVNRLMGEALKDFKPLRIVKIFELTASDEKKLQQVEFPIEHRGDIVRAGIAVVRPPEGQEPPLLFVENLSSEGPLETRPLSQRKLLEGTADLPAGEKTKLVLTRLLSRAFRRPATADELRRYTAIVDSTVAAGGKWEAGLQLAIQAVLVSPKFLFRLELDPSTAATAEPQPLDEYQLASRLSYFLWSSLPDDELTELARQKKLTEQLPTQVRRMLKDPKANALIDQFALQWLQLGRLQTVAPDAKLFPGFNEQLRAAMLQETRLFLAELVREDRSLLNILSSNYTYLNEPLAKHYGIADTLGNRTGKPATRPGGQPIKGPNFVRVEVVDTGRGGILTQASVLTVTSNPTRTSPVKRGRWVLEQLLGAPPPPPPPNVPELDKNDGQPLTGSLRQRMEQHRQNPACANCHASMDPLGFAFENFDAIGAFREKDGDFAIDPAGVLPGGKSFQGPAELQAILLEKHEQFTRCVAEKMLTYALGRGLEYYDQPTIDKVAQAVAREDYKFSTLVIEIVGSQPFRFRRGKE